MTCPSPPPGSVPPHERSVLDRALAATVGALHHHRDDDGYVTFWRLPKWAMDRIDDAQLRAMASMPAGVRIEMLTDAPSVELDVRLTMLQLDDAPLRPAVFDVVVEGEDAVRSIESTAGTHVRIDQRTGAVDVAAAGPTTIRVTGLPGRADRRVEVWLPHNAVVGLRDVRIPGRCDAVPAPSRRPVWVHHGSSISHCMGAPRPTDPWPVVVARRRGVSLLDLGFAGECLLDQFTARAIRDTVADAISLKIGVNVVNRDMMRERAFASALHGFLDTVRDGHATSPLVVATPIHCPPTETEPGPTVIGDDRRAHPVPRPAVLGEGSLTVERVREVIARVVAARRAAGDGALFLLDGLALLGVGDAVRLADGTHPDAVGDRLIADRFERLTFGPGAPFAALAGS